jgi:hypothetical protein
LYFSLFTKTLKRKSSEVLYRIDPIEKFAVQQLEVEWKKRKSVTEVVV